MHWLTGRSWDTAPASLRQRLIRKMAIDASFVKWFIPVLLPSGSLRVYPSGMREHQWITSRHGTDWRSLGGSRVPECRTRTHGNVRTGTRGFFSLTRSQNRSLDSSRRCQITNPALQSSSCPVCIRRMLPSFMKETTKQISATKSSSQGIEIQAIRCNGRSSR